MWLLDDRNLYCSLIISVKLMKISLKHTVCLLIKYFTQKKFKKLKLKMILLADCRIKTRFCRNLSIRFNGSDLHKEMITEILVSSAITFFTSALLLQPAQSWSRPCLTLSCCDILWPMCSVWQCLLVANLLFNPLY